MSPEPGGGLLARLLPSREPVPRLPSDDLDPRLLWGAVLALLVLHAVLAWLGRPPGILTSQDDATYLTLARSLREGLGYRELFHVGWPVHTKYPPFYPALLSLWGGMFGEGADAVAALNIIASTGTLAVVYLAVRRISTATAAVACLTVLALNPFLLARAGTGFSEPVYTFLAVLALWFTFQSSNPRAAAAAGATAILAALTRSVGVTLLAALAVHWALERRWRRVSIFSALVLATVGVWLGWSFMAQEHIVGDSYMADALFVEARFQPNGDGGPGPGSTMRQLAAAAVSVGRRMVDHATTYVGLTLPWRLPLPTISGSPVDNLVGAVGSAIALVSGTIVLLRRWRPAGLYVGAYGLLIAFWPWLLGRFLEPLLPLLVPAVVLGTSALVRQWFAERGALVAGALVVLTIGLTAGGRSLSFVGPRAECSAVDLEDGGKQCMTPDQWSYFRALGWIRKNAAPDAVVLTAKPQPLYWHTGRTTVDELLAAEVPPASFYQYMDQEGVDYILLGSLRSIEMGRYPDRLEMDCQRLEPVQQFPPRTWLFRLRPPSGNESGTDQSPNPERPLEVGKVESVPDSPSGSPGCRALERFREENDSRRFNESLLFFPGTGRS